MLTPTHARMARAALKWSLLDLQKATGISKNTLVRFETSGGVHLSTAQKIEEVFVREGISFMDESDAHGFGVTLSDKLVERIVKRTSRPSKAKSEKRSQKAK